jgi:hypothetical protein
MVVLVEAKALAGLHGERQGHGATFGLFSEPGIASPPPSPDLTCEARMTEGRGPPEERRNPCRTRVWKEIAPQCRGCR